MLSTLTALFPQAIITPVSWLWMVFETGSGEVVAIASVMGQDLLGMAWAASLLWA